MVAQFCCCIPQESRFWPIFAFFSCIPTSSPLALLPCAPTQRLRHFYVPLQTLPETFDFFKLSSHTYSYLICKSYGSSRFKWHQCWPGPSDPRWPCRSVSQTRLTFRTRPLPPFHEWLNHRFTMQTRHILCCSISLKMVQRCLSWLVFTRLSGVEINTGAL